MSELTFLQFVTHLFYNMQSEFQNKAILSGKAREVYFMTCNFSGASIIQILANLDKGLLQIIPK
jgi:hypothetical protein